MGWESLRWSEAIQLGGAEAMAAWWRSHIDANFDDYLSAEELPGGGDIYTDIYAPPEQVSWMVAKAVYANERWLLWLWPVEEGDPRLVTWAECQAIWLGVAMAETMGLDIAIVNDSKDAVRDHCGGRTSWKNGRPGIVWRRRQCVTQAHRLSRKDATKVWRSDDLPLEPDGKTGPLRPDTLIPAPAFCWSGGK